VNNIEDLKSKLSQAINDYPKLDLNSASELLDELHKKISSPITFKKLKEYSKSINVIENAWESESISYLLDIFEGQENTNLEDIIKAISI
jgi:hypothetical protein